MTVRPWLRLHLALGLAIGLAGACTASDDLDEAPVARAGPTIAAPSPTTTTPSSTTAPAYPRDDELRLSHVQVLGTHNSYHVEPVPELAAALAGFDQTLADSLAYSHGPISEQLDALGIRQIELDVFADPDGGRFVDRPLFAALGLDPPEPAEAMAEPGLKVLHVQDIDAGSTCPTLVSCLEEVRAWSGDHPGHTPILVLIEAKDAVIPDPLAIGFAQPLPFEEAALDALDAEVRSVLDEDQLLTPDDVRGAAGTLEEAVLTTGWPTLAEVRGKVLVALDNTDVIRDRYVARAPNLAGRALFTSSEPGRPDAAFLKRNDPVGDGDAIRAAVAAGYLVRTRADADTVEARTGDRTTAEAALASGAQFVSTDFPEPDQRYGPYHVAIPGGAPARCNPVSAPPGCTATDIESSSALDD